VPNLFFPYCLFRSIRRIRRFQWHYPEGFFNADLVVIFVGGGCDDTKRFFGAVEELSRCLTHLCLLVASLLDSSGRFSGCYGIVRRRGSQISGIFG
jgi:hypothetical protein